MPSARYVVSFREKIDVDANYEPRYYQSTNAALKESANAWGT